MPRPRPPHLSRERTRHGKAVWYVRIDGRRTRLRAEYGTPEFDAEYQAALAGKPQTSAGSVAPGTLAWLFERYRETGAWQRFSVATKRQRENIIRQVLVAAGDVPIARITTAVITAGRDRRAVTPFQARHFLDTVRGLFRWALKAGMVKIDPTVGIDDPVMPKTKGFPEWTEEEVTAYEKRWPIGTRQRVWLDVLLYTGLRRGDATRFGRQHIRNGIGTIKTEKTGTEVTLPILPILQATLDAGPCGDLTFIISAHGRPFTSKDAFGAALRDACHAAGIIGKSAHGLRKVAATRAANAGATEAQLKAIFGWTTDSMAGLYTRAADRRRLAREAMHKLGTGNESRTPIVAP
jgi:integrase